MQKILISALGKSHRDYETNGIVEGNEYSLHIPSKKAVFGKKSKPCRNNDSPWTVAACSLIKKSAGLGGGVLENFGDLGSEIFTKLGHCIHSKVITKRLPRIFDCKKTL